MDMALGLIERTHQTKNELLDAAFFDRPADKAVRDLIGCVLCRQLPDSIERLIITETEAYLGAHDLACHASKGRTPRTEIMFGPAGTIYVYLIYGMHKMLNVVTGAVG